MTFEQYIIFLLQFITRNPKNSDLTNVLSLQTEKINKGKNVDLETLIKFGYNKTQYNITLILRPYSI